jgi:hypothetical protein
MERETRIQNALKDLRDQKCSTIAEASNKWDVKYNTLWDRFKGITTTRLLAQEPRMKISLSQEKAVVQWIIGLTKKGFPPTYTLLKNRVLDLIQRENPNAPPLGKNYAQAFIERHKELGVAFANRRDKKRVLPKAKEVYMDFFDKVSILKLMLGDIYLTYLVSKGV